MKSLLALAAAFGLAAAPAIAQVQPRDTGSMAYPAPLPQGNLSTTTVGPQAPDTGSMAYPAPVPQGNDRTTAVGAQPRDTGSMAYPAPLPQGNVGSSTVR